MVEKLKGSNKTIGITQSMKAVANDIVNTAYVSKDADHRVVDKFVKECEIKHIEIVYVEDMQKLGKSHGISVGASVVCILKNS